MGWLHDAGVPHHLLGTVSPNVEFTAKDFRDFSIPVSNPISVFSIYIGFFGLLFRVCTV